MANTCAAMGSFTKLAVESTGSSPRTFANTSERYGFLAESLKVVKPYQGRRRITGDRSQYSDAVRTHSYLARGAIVLQPGPADLDNWLPRYTWGTESPTDQFNLGDTQSEFDVLIDRENKVFHYTECIGSKCVFRSTTEAGNEPTNEELIEMICYIMGKDESTATAWPSPEPSLTLGSTSLPYLHSEGVFTFNSNATRFRNWEMTIDNMVVPLFYNSLSPSCFRSMGRRITLKMQNPFTATTWTDAVAALNSGVAATLVFTNGTLSTTFTFPHLRNRYQTPTTSGRSEIPLFLELEAFRTSGSMELVVTNDATV